jgi:hypothetical protein
MVLIIGILLESVARDRTPRAFIDALSRLSISARLSNCGAG